MGEVPPGGIPTHGLSTAAWLELPTSARLGTGQDSARASLVQGHHEASAT